MPTRLKTIPTSTLRSVTGTYTPITRTRGLTQRYLEIGAYNDDHPCSKSIDPTWDYGTTWPMTYTGPDGKVEHRPAEFNDPRVRELYRDILLATHMHTWLDLASF